MTGHPSSLELDAYAHGFSSDAATHVETCARCRALVETTREEAQRFSRSVLPRTVDAVATRRPRFVWLWALAPALAVIPLVLWMRPRPLDPAMMPRVEQATPVEHEAEPVAKLSAFAFMEHFDPIPPRELHDRDRADPGELLRLTVDEHALRYVVVLSSDARGKVTVRAPIDGGSSIDIGDSGHADLPGTWLVEQGTMPVKIVALFSTHPIESSRLRDLLAHGDPLPADIVERRLNLGWHP